MAQGSRAPGARRWPPRAALAALASVAVLGGCAEERPPINRVQANALAKSFFVGEDLASQSDDPEFYTATTLIDVPYGADNGGPFPGLVGGLRRVKWEITEGFLNGRLTYESIDGVDGHGSRTTSDGQIVASYAIVSHFDIRRGYNPATGEENNIIEENTTDRPWVEREYFRVDWSTNLVTSSMEWDPLASDDYQIEPLAYYVNDPSSPDRPVFDPDQGYFDITNKLHLEPKTVTLDGVVNPACFYRGSLVVGATYPWGNCENSEITVRHSFKRVAQPGEDGFSDYEPVDWDGSRMNAVGVFTVQRLGWDRQYGIVDQKFRRFAQKYNIWQKSHLDIECATKESYDLGLDPTRDEDGPDVNADGVADGDGTHDECQREGAPAGSRCDELVGKCTIPYSQRQLRPVAWHYTSNSADDEVIYESTELATWEWDTALRIAVNAARRVECVRTGTLSLAGTPWAAAMVAEGDEATVRGNCAGLFPIDQRDDVEKNAVAEVNRCVKAGQSREQCVAGRDPNSVAAMRPMVVLCHSPVADGDDSACGEPGTVARSGDIRFHQINVWPTRQSSSPWGYGPSLSDPLTGEIVSAGINIYNAVTDSAAQSFLDQIRWMNGELKTSDITSATYVRDWVTSKNADDQMAGPLLSKAHIQHRIAGVAGVDPGDLARASAELAHDPAKLAELRRSMAQVAQDLHRERLPPGAIPEDRSKFDARIQMAKDSPVESELMNPMWLQMAAVPPDTPAEEKLEYASPLRGMSSWTQRLEEQHLHNTLAEKGQCMLGAPEPTGIPALAKVMARKFPYDPTAAPGPKKERLGRMWNYLRAKMNFNVILHEMGHTVGLRHNFVSSYDRFNFKPQYWQLRTRGGTVNTPCDGPTADGASCVGPRYHDPLDQDEIDQSVWTWQQTTVMDYAGDVTQDMLGLGVYDYAAARMFYADAVDVRDDPGQLEGSKEGNAVIQLVDNAGSIFGQFFVLPDNSSPHYSQWNGVFGLIRNCQPVTPTPPAWWNAERDGEWDPVFDGHIVRNEVCERAPVDYVAWEDMVPDQITSQLEVKYIVPRRARDQKGRPRMPYGFESDEYADGWTPSAYRHDNGADMYEELVFHSNLYENRHVFDNYRNSRVNFTVYGAYQRALSRYHAKVANLTQGFAYSMDFILREFAANSGFSFAQVVAANAGEGGFLYDHAVAASVGFDHFARVMTRPHTGPHYLPSAGSKVLAPTEDVITGQNLKVLVTMPNGNSVAGGDLSYGGRTINNDFQYGQGYWTIDYLNQAGSYYEKTFAIERMLEASYGAINFFRFDGLDARFRHVNFADLFPEGMRRLVGLMLTEDYESFGARVAAKSGAVETVAECPLGGDTCSVNEQIKYPAKPLAWVSFVPAAAPEACAPENGSLVCTDAAGGPFGNTAPTDAFVMDPQLGYEVQKFIVFWSYVYQPGSEMLDWVDMMRIYQLGGDLDPDYLPEQMVEWRDPESGLRYIAKKYGDEVIFGKTYDRGVAAKMIQWANHLTGLAYELDELTPFDPVTGKANVVLDASGLPKLEGSASCEDSKPCVQLRKYRGLIDFTRDSAAHLGFPEPALQIFGD